MFYLLLLYINLLGIYSHRCSWNRIDGVLNSAFKIMRAARFFFIIWRDFPYQHLMWFPMRYTHNQIEVIYNFDKIPDPALKTRYNKVLMTLIPFTHLNLIWLLYITSLKLDLHRSRWPNFLGSITVSFVDLILFCICFWQFDNY